MDVDSSGKLNPKEFEKFFSRIGVFLSTQEFRALYDIYDPNRDGEVSFQEFIDALRVSGLGTNLYRKI